MYNQTTSLNRIAWCSNNTNDVDVKYTEPDDEALEDLMEAHEAYMEDDSFKGYWYTDKDGNSAHSWDYEESIGE